MGGNRTDVPRAHQPEDNQHEDATEETPLLHTHDNSTDTDRTEQEDAPSPAQESLLQSVNGSPSGKGSKLKRWPSILALLILCVAIIVILVAAFVVPQVSSEYARQAVTFDPTSLSIASFTASGVVARVQGDFYMDGSRVKSGPIRNLGRFVTYIAREVETKPTTVEVSFPEYDSPVVGTAYVPSIKVNIQNGHINHIDILAQLTAGSKDAIRRVADDWVQGKLGQLRVLGTADVVVKTGLITLPKQTVAQSYVFEGSKIPDVPDFEILKLLVHDEDLPNNRTGLVADVSIDIANPYPIDLPIPRLGFEILVPNCAPEDPYIRVADAITHALHIQPKQDIELNVTGLVRQLPKEAMTACPGSSDSPLDVFLANYIRGQASTVYVRGGQFPLSAETPEWLVDLLSQITVPVAIPGRTFGHLIKEFHLSDVHFDFPDVFADPNSPDSHPRISAMFEAMIALPDEINFNIGVDRVRTIADVFYKKQKFGYLDLHEWQEAKSNPVVDSDEHTDLRVTSKVDKAPLYVTDNDVFGSVISELLTGSQGVNLTVEAKVDVEVETGLGKFVVREIPAEGKVPVHPIGKDGNNVGHDPFGMGRIAPKIGNLLITESTTESLTIEAAVNFTNPTNYTANIPFIDLHISVNETLVGHISVSNTSVVKGNNTNIPIRIIWQPSVLSGVRGAEIGAELISQYISGYNTSLTFSPYSGTVPAQPGLGQALQNISLTIPIPRLGSAPKSPDDDNDEDPTDPSDPDNDEDDKRPHFIRDAVMHIFTSSAQFTLASPLSHTTLYITHLNATAFYKGDGVGLIDYAAELEVPPGLTRTPRLPVEWSIGSVGYDAVKHALGGTLKLHAAATMDVRIGFFTVSVWFEGGGLGVSVRL